METQGSTAAGASHGHLPSASAALQVPLALGEVAALLGILLEARKTTEVLEMAFPGANTESRRVAIERLIGVLRRSAEDAARASQSSKPQG